MASAADHLTTWKFEWAHGYGSVQSLGGMLQAVHFKLGDQTVQPFLVATHTLIPDERKASVPALLSCGPSGEWPCVPFGSARAVKNMPADWESVKHEESEGAEHGSSSNSHWHLVSQTADAITLEFVSPPNDSIEKLTRIIRWDPKSPALHLELQVTPRRDASLSIGIHPCFNLEIQEGATELRPGNYNFGMTFPGDIEPTSILEPGQLFHSLNALKLKDGSTKDFSRLPLAEDTENEVQLCGASGVFELAYHTRKFLAKLEWNAEQYPSLLLWFSNRGRPDYPWLSKHVALGAEPLCAAFDLGTHVGTNVQNPLAKRGVKTATHFKAGETWTTNYKISVSSL